MSRGKLVRTDLQGFTITKGDFLMGSKVAEAEDIYTNLKDKVRGWGRHILMGG